MGGLLLIHCSAGVGRTGTFITLDIALEQVNNEGKVDIGGIVTRLRQQRTQMVQTEVSRTIDKCIVMQIAVYYCCIPLGSIHIYP